jgi:dihydroxyacetone kinase-like predicted kinase
MNKQDFINWLDRPITKTDEEIIDTLIEMIKNYDNKNEEIIELLLRIDNLEKQEKIEKLEV